MSTFKRSTVIDSCRGLAVVMMIVYHFCYDLTYFNLVLFNFQQDPFWQNFRSVIISLFLAIVGISLTLVKYHKVSKSKIIRRIVILFLCAALITLVSYFLFPGRTIVFGILHFITLASILALPFINRPVLSLLTGVSLIIIGINVTHTAFNQTYLHWIGLMTFKPATEDYVPLLPWLGAVLCGIYIGWLLNETGLGKKILQTDTNKYITGSFQWLGKNSLLVYMLHQPILFALLWLFIKLT